MPPHLPCSHPHHPLTPPHFCSAPGYSPHKANTFSFPLTLKDTVPDSTRHSTPAAISIRGFPALDPPQTVPRPASTLVLSWTRSCQGHFQAKLRSHIPELARPSAQPPAPSQQAHHPSSPWGREQFLQAQKFGKTHVGIKAMVRSHDHCTPEMLSVLHQKKPDGYVLSPVSCFCLSPAGKQPN